VHRLEGECLENQQVQCALNNIQRFGQLSPLLSKQKGNIDPFCYCAREIRGLHWRHAFDRPGHPSTACRQVLAVAKSSATRSTCSFEQCDG
jgi:hypothetical protein